ncbi:MAG: hypothetical protein WC661_21875 [Opitutaceae bacterium]|jgi:hypothetical protein
MSETNPASAKNSKVIGAVLVAAGIAFGIFVYSHRPPAGVGDMFQRGDSFFFKENVYFTLLALAVLLGIAGLVRIAKK